MARLALNKATLSKQLKQLKIFERFLPSLDLKRKQLLAERAKATAALARTEARLAPIADFVAEHFPMAARKNVDLAGLVRVSNVEVGQENVVGVRLPTLVSVEVEVHEFGLLGRPHWVDGFAALLKEAMEALVRVQVERRRLALLEVGVRRITQRVNLFEKVLIPRARDDIRRVRIYLSDAERAAVVRAKISKKKRLAQGLV